VTIEQLKNEYPFEPQSFDIDGLTMSYLDEGSRDGETIVLLHGNPTWSFYYRNLVKGLSDRYRVIVPDHIGCGLSSKPQDYPYNLATHISNLTKLIKHLNLGPITLAMHDWGGAIGMGYAIDNRDEIKRLVIFNTAAFLSDRIPASINFCRIPVIGEIVVRLFNGFLGAGLYLGFGSEKSNRIKNEVREGYLYPYRNSHDRIAIARFVQDIPMSPNHPTYPLVKSIGEKLTQFREVPAEIIWGMKDFCFDETFLKRWMEYLPGAKVRRFEDAGHWVVEDAHEKIIPILNNFMES
jgi:haloalkane dehalogenase